MDSLETAVKIWGESPHAGSNDTPEITNLRQEMEQMAEDGMTDREMKEFYSEVISETGMHYSLSDLPSKDAAFLREQFPLTCTLLAKNIS